MRLDSEAKQVREWQVNLSRIVTSSRVGQAVNPAIQSTVEPLDSLNGLDSWDYPSKSLAGLYVDLCLSFIFTRAKKPKTSEPITRRDLKDFERGRN
jgi:hypothetical protein